MLENIHLKNKLFLELFSVHTSTSNVFSQIVARACIFLHLIYSLVCPGYVKVLFGVMFLLFEKGYYSRKYGIHLEHFDRLCSMRNCTVICSSTCTYLYCMCGKDAHSSIISRLIITGSSGRPNSASNRSSSGRTGRRGKEAIPTEIQSRLPPLAPTTDVCFLHRCFIFHNFSFC